jgi:hypothetical protein
MANTITHNDLELDLLNFLEESRRETQKQSLKYEEDIRYWESDEPDYEDDFGKITNDQREHYLSNARNGYNKLNFRSIWLQSQITQIKSLNQ